MKRRKFLMGAATLLACPYIAQGKPFPKVGFFMHLPEGDPEGQSRYLAFRKELDQLTQQRGLKPDIQVIWPDSSVDRFEMDAKKLIALSPDVIVASTSRVMIALQKANSEIPIVFVNVVDPVGAGFVENIAHPGKNVTGFTLFEYSIAPKWLELLTELVPGVRRVAVLADFNNPSGEHQFSAIKQVAARFHVELSPISSHSADDVDSGIAAFANKKAGQALIVTASSSQSIYRDVIIGAADRFKLPAIYPLSYYTGYGGLAAYGPDRIEQYRRAAGYVLRILQGEKPGDLPVQAPTKFELSLNLRTAKALGLAVAPSLLARAEEVIE